MRSLSRKEGYVLRPMRVHAESQNSKPGRNVSRVEVGEDERSMIKTKLFFVRGYHRHEGNMFFGVADYLYCIYIFGYLVRAVPITGIDITTLRTMFPNEEVIDRKEKF